MIPNALTRPGQASSSNVNDYFSWLLFICVVAQSQGPSRHPGSVVLGTGPKPCTKGLLAATGLVAPQERPVGREWREGMSPLPLAEV